MSVKMAVVESDSSLSQGLLKALPNLQDDVIKKVMETFSEVGVEQVTDIQHLHESDLASVLKPIQIRKLIACCSTAGSSQDPGSAEGTSVADSQPTSPQTSTLSKSKRCSDLTWPMDIDIPLDKAPELKGFLQQGQRLNSDIRRNLVRTLIDQVRFKTHHATKQQLACVAQRIVTKYPDSLQDRIGSVLVGSGFDSLAKQLVSRNENLNRNSGAFSGNKRKTERVYPADVNSEKKKKMDSYGCSNWSPEIDHEDGDRFESVRIKLKEMSTSPNYDGDEIKRLMADSFPLQRKLINSGASISMIMTEWPFFVNESVLLAHVNQLLGFDLKTTLANAYLSKAVRLNRYFTSGLAGKTELQTYFQEAKEQSDMDNIQALLQAVILGVLVCLGENENALFLVVDEMSTRQDVEKVNTENWPRLAMLGDSVLAAKQFMLLVDGEVICDSTSFVTALSALFGAYYMFNIEYPKAGEATLEFIQRCFVGINPDKGCKSGKRKKTAVNPKVLKLINGIADFEWTSQ